MKRLLPVLAAVVLAGACSGGGGAVAATVNGVDIEVATVEGLIDNADEPLTDAQFRSILTALVQWNAIADAAREQFNIDPTDDEVSEFADGILATQGAGLTREEFIQAQIGQGDLL